MIKGAEIVYVDPDRRTLFVGKIPGDGVSFRYAACTQKDGGGSQQKLRSKYVAPEGYDTLEEAQAALSLHVSNARTGASYARWEVYVNGKLVPWNDYYAMGRGDVDVPMVPDRVSIVTLETIEYRIAHHMRGAYSEFLAVGRCLIEAKDAGLVPHGQWEDWVRIHTGMTERQAQRLMQAARGVAAGSALERLPMSKIQAILTLPEPEREEMAERADKDDMSLRQLQEEIRAQKARAEQAERSLASVKEELGREADERIAMCEQDIREQVRGEIKALTGRLDEQLAREGQLRRELKAAMESANNSPSGISPEAQAEIDRLARELAEAEEYAAKQAEQRQALQREMLTLQQGAARGDYAGASSGFTAADLAGAVRVFIGAAGVLPHMGTDLCRIDNVERQEYMHYLDMLDAWMAGTRQALGMVLMESGEGLRHG